MMQSYAKIWEKKKKDKIICPATTIFPTVGQEWRSAEGCMVISTMLRRLQGHLVDTQGNLAGRHAHLDRVASLVVEQGLGDGRLE